MKFRIERDTFADALSKVTRAVSARPSIPAIGGVHLTVTSSELTLVGTDLDHTIEKTVAVKDATDGVALLPAKLLNDIVRNLSGTDVVLDSPESDDAKVTSGRSVFTVRKLPANEFPRLADVPDTQTTFEAESFAAALSQVLPAASKDSGRPILSGVLFNSSDSGLLLVATDSYRLAVRDLPGSALSDTQKSVLVPAASLGNLPRLLGKAEKVTAALGAREIVFGFDRTKIRCRLLEGDYPNWSQLLPDSLANKLHVDRDALLDALRRVQVLLGDNQPVKLQLGNEELAITGQAAEVGSVEESVAATYEGEALTVSFNPRYLAASVEAFDSGLLTLEIGDPAKATKLTGTTGLTYIVMPMRS